MISVICSNYNSLKWIENYCNYLNSQILNRFEVIFVDANSTDDSLKVIKDFSFREGIEVSIIELKQRVSVYEAWNVGIKASTYDYVMNYNADDKLFGNTLYTLYAYTTVYPHIDVIYSNCLISNSPTHNNITGIYNWNDANDINNLLQGCCCGPFPLLKKQKVIDCGMFNPSFTISGDYEMWCRMKSKGATFKKLDEYLGVYYQNPEGVSTAPNAERHTRHVQEDIHIREMYK